RRMRKSRAGVSAYANDWTGTIVQVDTSDPTLAHVLEHDAGLTLFIFRMDELFPEFGPWIQRFREQTGHPTVVYDLTFMGGSHSTLQAHMDTFSVFSIVCEGRKRWQYATEATFLSPIESIGADSAGRVQRAA